MKRREFTKAATAAAAVAVVTGCGGGGGGGDVAAGGQVPAPAPGPAPDDGSSPPAPAPAPAPGPAPTPAPPAPVPPAGPLAIGTNLTGMDAAISGLRFGPGTLPNVNYTVPRKADVAWMAANGYNKNRLPIQWELLQPMLHDTVANAAARAAIGQPGAFDANQQAYITGVLDAHAAAGIKCIIDLHNYCRYIDFVFQPDGSVRGLVDPPDPLIQAYTTDNTQVQTRIIAAAPGATLKVSNLIDFWTRAARLWKDHPGFGGYGLMNEPNRLPPPGSTTPETVDGTQDLNVWAAYAQPTIDAIRAIDPVNPIYLGGNDWSGSISLASKNPSWPLRGTNIIYEVHTYLDAVNSGQRFDFDSDVALGLNAGFASGPITLNTGVDRLKLAVDWAQPRGLTLAVTETAMPIDDPRWQEMFLRLASYARQNGIEFYSWNGGSHWLSHNAPINMVPGWHQNKTLDPQTSGPMKQAAGIVSGALFDDGPGWAPAGTPITITVYSRGNLGSPVTLRVTSSNGGTLSKSQVTIGAGANQQDSFTFSAAPNTVTTLSYTVVSGALAPPPPRKVYSLSDPVAFAATSLPDAALAILAKYSACKWDMNDGFTDFELGAPSAAGQPVRAVADSGYGSSFGNAMEMLNSINTDSPAMGNLAVPVMRVTGGRKNVDFSAPNTTGFMCRKPLPIPDVLPHPLNRMPYTAGDAHFIMAAASVPGANSGIVFQASVPFNVYSSELNFANGRPQARLSDQFGAPLALTSPTALAPNTPAVMTFTSEPNAQRLRVNSSEVASASLLFAVSPFDQLQIGWGFAGNFPQLGFGGNLYSVVTGKGAPTPAELAVLERYLAATAGIA